ncbi:MULTISPECIES: IS110 family transposase [Nonomuraea]|uniref:IS110 family transposase n=1 Tax=Nonomuraea ferruginea TaxID=46174 RepID=A0ABT4T245_9ACTN|nr:IS110 family transposase [Nonomuraea ferruginea]MDA0643557.1 IS110 family transposase [Nonomuraea ferruginea]
MTEFKKPKARRIVGGVDTHADTHHAAVVLMNGRRVADREFQATRAGYANLLQWMRSFGRLHAVGVEGTGSYGAALARHLSSAKVKVIEVNRPDRQQRRAKGKSDPLDAYSAAEAVLAERAGAVPKSGNGVAESIRVLHVVRAGAVKARTACINELQALIVTAPAELREQLAGLKKARLVDACLRLRPSADLADPAQSVKAALRYLAARYRALSAEIDATYNQWKALIEQARPELLTTLGVGVETAAQLLTTCGDNPDRLRSEGSFAALCGVSPVPASSGKTRRHRLNRGGDRQANRALYVIVLSRMSCDPSTRAYVERRTTDGLSKREIIRCLKRYVARQLYKIIIRPQAPVTESSALA